LQLLEELNDRLNISCFLVAWFEKLLEFYLSMAGSSAEGEIIDSVPVTLLTALATVRLKEPLCTTVVRYGPLDFII
jgi:hypothetical protein